MFTDIYLTLTSLLGEDKAFEAIANHPYTNTQCSIHGVFQYTNLWAETLPAKVTQD